MMANAWGVFNDTAQPDLIFVVLQIAVSIMIMAYVLAGKKLFPKVIATHLLFRIIEIILLIYAAYFFYSKLHMHLMSLLQTCSVLGLCYLSFSERKAFQHQIVGVDKEGIRLPAIDSRKFIAWKNVENLRIRNDYISVNTTGNRFIQYETGSTYGETELDSMNAWCFQQLSAVNKHSS